MANWLVDLSLLDDEQEKVLDAPLGDSKVIRGCAGSGKTILAVLMAQRIKEKQLGTFQVVVFTKALRQFIQQGINTLQIPNTSVSHYEKWDRTPTDYLIVDEAQDFTKDEIDVFIKCAKKAVIFLGDSAQQLYKGMKGKENLVDMESIVSYNNYPLYELENNYRLPLPLAKVAQSVLGSSINIVSNCKKQTGDKPIVKKRENEDAELDYIIDYIQNENLKDVGILLSNNNQVQKVYDYFTSKGVQCGYKTNLIDELNFNANNPQIMTYHSAKGLQFESVFLPLCDNIFAKNAFYVALTRATKMLVMTYSAQIPALFNFVPSDLYIA